MPEEIPREQTKTKSSNSPRQTWQDYSHEVRLLSSKPLRLTLIATSSLFLLLGIIGIFLPLLPTTPFVLLAAACFARSSITFYNWLMNHRHVGPPLRQWKEQRFVSRRTKRLAISLIWSTMLPSIIWLVPLIVVRIFLLLVAVTVTIIVWRLPGEKR